MPSTTLQPGPRLITVPDAAPPYDCDAHSFGCPARHDLTGAKPHTEAEPCTGAGPYTEAEPYTGAGPYTEAGPYTGAEPYGGEASTEPVQLSGASSAAASGWPRQFAQVLVEVLAGVRSPRQIASCTTDRVRATVDVLTPRVTEGSRPRIQRVMLSHPAAHAVEMTVVVSFGPRARALAIRCEHLPPRPAAPGRPGRPAHWLCTELEAG